MKSSMTQATHRGMIIQHARFSRRSGQAMWPLKSKLKTHEIEHDEIDTQRDDYRACEIPSDR